MGQGLLLINLGTPNSPNVSGVRAYLRQFLTDKRVINLPAVLRYALVYGFILPFRPKISALAYQKIWTAKGSPLLCNSQKLADKIKEQAGTNSAVAIGMRYGSPSIAEALDNLKHCDSIYVVPLYPQYSSAATGSSIEETLHILASWEVIPSLHVIRDFYCYPPYIKAQAQTIKKYLGNQDHLLFSYHGIPENQLVKTGCKSSCTGSCPEVSNDNSACYRAQCMQTSRLLAKELHLQPNQYDSSFQSRLGKTPWIKPYTDAMLINLASRGIKNLTISCPSFVADCLETLEEIGMRAKHQWLALGGERFTLVPSMNDDAAWVEAILKLVPNSNEIAKL